MQYQMFSRSVVNYCSLNLFVSLSKHEVVVTPKAALGFILCAISPKIIN